VNSMPFGQLVDSVARQRTFDALLVEIAVSGDPDPYTFFHSTEVTDPGHNFSGFSTLPIDRNLEAARRTFDEGARRDLYAPVFQAIAKEVPVVFLYFSDYLYAQSALRGMPVAHRWTYDSSARMVRRDGLYRRVDRHRRLPIHRSTKDQLQVGGSTTRGNVSQRPWPHESCETGTDSDGRGRLFH